KYLFNQHSVTTFSANFEIYGDISKRITSLLTTITPRTEVYSVDESFLDLSELPIRNYNTWGRAVRESIFKNVGVPVSIGIAPSKTLAKLGADIAKTNASYRGAVDWVNASAAWKKEALGAIPVEGIWGVG